MTPLFLSDIITQAEYDLARSIWTNDREHFHSRVTTEVCEPACARRDDLVPAYLAYLLEYLFTKP